MRLNRVLLLAAVINLMIFAMVFTISCSGEDGKNGKAGVDCSLSTDSDGIYIVTCGEEEVGQIPGGANAKGPEGDAGKPGRDGDNCWLGDKIDGAYLIICGKDKSSGEVKGNLGTCDVQSTNKYEFIITCGVSTINMCGTTVYDPALKYCAEGGYVNDITEDYCDGVTSKQKYNTHTHYCGYTSEADWLVGKARSILPLCGTSNGDENKPNAEEWLDEYCRYVGPKVENAKISTETCGLKKAKLNENGWKSQYCGYASAEATEVSVLTGACEVKGEAGDPLEYKGPNEVAFGRGYCQANNLNKLYYSEDLCGANGKPNDGKWKHEYCGFENKNNTTKKVYSDACDIPGDPNETVPTKLGAHAIEFNGGYCQSNRFGTTTYTDEVWCGEDAEAGKNGPENRLNEGAWKGEYCGVDANDAPTKYEGACDEDDGDDHVGPNTSEFGSGFCMYSIERGRTFRTTEFCGSETLNEGKWKGEYCGYASAAAEASETKSVLTGACDKLESDEPKGPNSEGYQAGYCMPKLETVERLTEYTSADDACENGRVPNLGKWNGEYCGYANKTAYKAGTTSVIKPSTSEGGEKCAVLKPKANGYNFYCQAQNAEGELAATDVTCGESSSSRKYNEGSWKGEYCFSDKKVKACKGGLFGNSDLRSDDPSACISVCSNRSSGSTSASGGINYYVNFTNECIANEGFNYELIQTNVCGSGKTPTELASINGITIDPGATTTKTVVASLGLSLSAWDQRVCRCQAGYVPNVNPFTSCYIKGVSWNPDKNGNVDSSGAAYPHVKAPVKNANSSAKYLADVNVCKSGAPASSGTIATNDLMGNGTIGTGDYASACTCTGVNNPYWVGTVSNGIYIDGACVQGCAKSANNQVYGWPTGTIVSLGNWSTVQNTSNCVLCSNGLGSDGHCNPTNP